MGLLLLLLNLSHWFLLLTHLLIFLFILIPIVEFFLFIISILVEIVLLVTELVVVRLVLLLLLKNATPLFCLLQNSLLLKVAVFLVAIILEYEVVIYRLLLLLWLIALLSLLLWFVLVTLLTLSLLTESSLHHFYLCVWLLLVLHGHIDYVVLWWYLWACSRVTVRLLHAPHIHTLWNICLLIELCSWPLELKVLLLLLVWCIID